MNTIRWRLVDFPDSVKFKPSREKTHPEITDYEQIEQDQKIVLQRIKCRVNQILPNAVLYLFGSRKNGNWIEESDYDIMVIDLDITNRQKIELKSKDYGVKVDLFFHNNILTNHYVEIK